VTLRSGLLLAVGVLLVVSLVLVGANLLPGWWLLFNSAVLAAALVFERRGYHPQAPRDARLQPTEERFIDPTTGELTEVWEDSATGAREYRSSPPEED
jgi:hypothetical protein